MVKNHKNTFKPFNLKDLSIGLYGTDAYRLKINRPEENFKGLIMEISDQLIDSCSDKLSTHIDFELIENLYESFSLKISSPTSIGLYKPSSYQFLNIEKEDPDGTATSYANKYWATSVFFRVNGVEILEISSNIIQTDSKKDISCFRFSLEIRKISAN